MFIQVGETLKTANELLGDLSGFRAFRKEAEDLREEFRNWRQEQFDSWSRDAQEQIDDPKQPLRSDAAVVVLLTNYFF